MRHSIFRMLAFISICTILTVGTIGISTADQNESLSVTFLDVGKGDCILIEKDGHAALIDAGYEETSDQVLFYLRQNGISSLDWFVVTHYDKDHVGGAAAIAQNLSVGRVYLPGYEGTGEYYESFMNAIEEKNLPSQNVTEDIDLDLSGAQFRLCASDLEYIPDNKGGEGNDNDVSLVIELKWGGDSFLFAGDLEKEGIKSFLEADHGNFDVVKMPHHGRNESNTDDFIESTAPKIAVITDSKDEEAEKKVTKALKSADAQVYRSSKCGHIIIKSTGTGEYTVSVQNP